MEKFVSDDRPEVTCKSCNKPDRQPVKKVHKLDGPRAVAAKKRKAYFDSLPTDK